MNSMKSIELFAGAGGLALGAIYTLIDYLANRIAEIGETPEGEEE